MTKRGRGRQLSRTAPNLRPTHHPYPKGSAVPLATFTFGDALLTTLEFAFLFLWIWIAVGVVFDIFRSHDLSNWGKALWMLLIILLPYLGVLGYLLVRGH